MLNCVRRSGPAVAVAFALLASAGVQASEPPHDFSDLATKMLPAVVNISTTQETPAERGTLPGMPPGAQEEPAPGDAPPDASLGEVFKGNPQAVPAPEPNEHGSGFIIEPDGYIGTHNHVVVAAKERKM